MRELKPEPLTADAFAPFGRVIEASEAAVKVDINFGHAVRYDSLAEIDVADGGGKAVISLFRARPLGELVLRQFENHPLGSQSFVPLSGRPFLVGVSDDEAGRPGRPMIFLAQAHQGVNYFPGILHHPLMALGEVSDFLVVDRDNPAANLEEFTFDTPFLIREPQP